MKYCGECGKETRIDTKFCNSCGAKFDDDTEIKPVKVTVADIAPHKPLEPIIEVKQRTMWLYIIIALNYLAMAALIIISLAVFLDGLFFTLIGFVFAAYVIWINEGLKRYDGTRRGINIGLLSVYAVFSLVTLELLLIIPAGLQIYGLVFHKPTIELFK